jgi:subtilisin family serine protease
MTAEPSVPSQPTKETPAQNAQTAQSKHRGVAPDLLQMPPLPPHSNTEVLAVSIDQAALQQAAKLGFSLLPRSNAGPPDHRVTRLLVPSGMDAVEARRLLEMAAPQAKLGLNYYYRPYVTAFQKAAAVADPGGLARSDGGCPADRCYGASVIKWQPELGACARGVRVGVIDTAMDLTHPSLATKAVHVGYIPPRGRRAAGSSQHGTGVLSVLAGQSTSSTPGLVPQAEYFVANVFYEGEDGQPMTDTASLLDAFNWMGTWNVNVINLSLAGPRDELIEKAIEQLSQNKVVFVAAAGNEGPGAVPSYPAAYSPVIAVTAIGKDFRSYRFASHGDYIDLAAPGVDIWAAAPGGKQGYQTGTSFATPFVTAVVASIYQSLPHKSKAAVLHRLTVLDLGPPGPDRVYGRGLVQAPESCAPTGPTAIVTAGKSARSQDLKTASR